MNSRSWIRIHIDWPSPPKGLPQCLHVNLHVLPHYSITELFSLTAKLYCAKERFFVFLSDNQWCHDSLTCSNSEKVGSNRLFCNLQVHRVPCSWSAAVAYDLCPCWSLSHHSLFSPQQTGRYLPSLTPEPAGLFTIYPAHLTHIFSGTGPSITSFAHTDQMIWSPSFLCCLCTCCALSL